MKNTNLLTICGLILGTASPAFCDDHAVSIDLVPDEVRSIGGITTLEREKYLVIHATPDESDMSEEIVSYILNDLGAYYGRDGGIQTGRLQTVPADPDRPGMPDTAYMAQEGKQWIAERAGNPRFAPEHMREVVLCTHPEYMVAREGNDSAAFGPETFESAAEFVANFLKHYYTDETRPQYYEVFNEPFIKTEKTGTTARHMAEQHVVAARRIRELLPNDDIMIGGYSAAWAEVEARNFEHWNGWQKMFMDVAGDEMDFFSTHLYDGINVKGTHAERTGSNTEAILDLIDSYSFIKFGVAKPQAITEYGRINKSPENKVWPDRLRRMGILLASFNGMMMTYMDHPDRLIKTVPYILGVGSWTYGNPANMTSTEEVPNSFLLFRRAGDNYVPTELEKFYLVWKGIDGERRVLHSDDPDLRGHYFADGLRHSVVLHNMDDRPRTVKLSGLDDVDITKTALRSLQTHGEIPLLTERTLFGVPEELELQVGETAVLLLDLRKEHAAKQVRLETRVYATDYLQAIEADQDISFTFNDVPGGEGDGVLRLAIGREQDKSLQPQVTIGGKELVVPTDWAGDQRDRKLFFGVIEVPVPSDLLTPTTEVQLRFPDTGGKVASAVLQVNRLSAN
ncbi:MAG: beta-agarase [Planctomycetota bacterium]